MTPPQPAHDTLCDGLTDAKRVADREHDISDAGLIRVAESDHREILELDLQYRQVALGVRADQLRSALAAVVQSDLDLVRRFDHVMVGENVTLRAYDDARTQAGGALALSVELVAEKAPEHRVVHERMAPHLLAGEDVDHGGHGFSGRWAVRAGGLARTHGFLD